MRVGVDTNGLYTSRAGVARYIWGLLHGLRRLAPSDFEAVEVGWPVTNYAFKQPLRTVKTVYREIVWTRTRAPRLLAAERVELLHATSNLRFALPRSVKRVCTLYDLAVLRQPERFRRWHRSSWQRHLNGLAGADRVICISRFTADEAIELLGLQGSKIEVVHCGGGIPEEDTTAEGEPGEPPAPMPELPPEYFLFVGSLEPGKNLALLRDTYREARTQGISLPPLAIVGSRWKGVAREGAPVPGWIFLGRQPDAVLTDLYRRAIALVFPSKYEGFGLPLLEAMRTGCPVVCSPVASLPEIAGDAALLTPQDSPSYLQAMTRLVEDDALRDDLVRKGRRRAKMFSWERCARQTLEVYETVMR